MNRPLSEDFAHPLHPFHETWRKWYKLDEEDLDRGDIERSEAERDSVSLGAVVPEPIPATLPESIPVIPSTHTTDPEPPQLSLPLPSLATLPPAFHCPSYTRPPHPLLPLPHRTGPLHLAGYRGSRGEPSNTTATARPSNTGSSSNQTSRRARRSSYGPGTYQSTPRVPGYQPAHSRRSTETAVRDTGSAITLARQQLQRLVLSDEVTASSEQEQEIPTNLVSQVNQEIARLYS